MRKTLFAAAFCAAAVPFLCAQVVPSEYLSVAGTAVTFVESGITVDFSLSEFGPTYSHEYSDDGSDISVNFLAKDIQTIGTLYVYESEAEPLDELYGILTSFSEHMNEFEVLTAVQTENAVCEGPVLIALFVHRDQFYGSETLLFCSVIVGNKNGYRVKFRTTTPADAGLHEHFDAFLERLFAIFTDERSAAGGGVSSSTGG